MSRSAPRALAAAKARFGSLGRLGPLEQRDWKRRLARYNHVLIPDKKLDRDRLRQRRWARILSLGFAASQALTREGRALFVLLLPVGLAALDVRYGEVHFLWAMLLGLLLAAFLVRPLYKVERLAVKVRNAARVAVNQELFFELELQNWGGTPLFDLRVLPPFLPWDGHWTGPAQGLGALEPEQTRQLGLRARFQARGEHHLDTFNVGSLVLGGLAVGPSVASDGPRFLVVPKLAEVSDIDFGRPEREGAGTLASSVQPGEVDVAGVRPYRFGDELKHLHARTWARTGIPHVRYYLDERRESLVLAVLTGAPKVSERVKEAALSLAAGVAARLTLHQGGLDRFLCDSECFELMPPRGESALDRVLDQLAVLEFSAKCPELGATEQALGGATGALFISVEDSPALTLLVERTRARGIPCIAVLVVEPGVSVNSALTQVQADAIEEGRVIRL